MSEKKDKEMVEGGEYVITCLVCVAFVAFALFASIALGMLVGAWLGFATAAVFALLVCLRTLVYLGKSAMKNEDGDKS